MRWTAARGATAAGVLPAAFLVALLVGAPFAGTTTAPLIADRAATAPADGSASYDAADDVTASAPQSAADLPDSAVPGAATTDDRTASLPAPDRTVPRASMVTLVVSWLTLAFVGLAVLLAAARGAHRRLAYSPVSPSDSSSRA